MNFLKIRTLVVTSIFSDDILMKMFSLKGGNALELGYDLADFSRASTDIDLSMDKDFKDYGLTEDQVKKKIEYRLNENFIEEGYKVFDVKLIPQPKKENVKRPQWGGYNIEFKFINRELFEENQDDIDSLRRKSQTIDEDTQKKKMSIDISKFEFIEESELISINQYFVQIYTPTMIVYEKLRAICQQMESYQEIMHSNLTPRARDFYDIYIVVEKLVGLEELVKTSNLEILKEIFEVKKVPIDLLHEIKNPEIKEFHRDDFLSVKDSVLNSQTLKTYDFYYNYVVNLVKKIANNLNKI